MKTITSRRMALLFIMPVILYGCAKDAAVKSPQSTTSSSTEDMTASKTFVYIIEQGNHYANGQRFPIFFGKVLTFSATFDSSAIYNFTDPKTKNDQNTLYGFADNYKKHQQFSARFGWRWHNNQLQIAAYTNNFNDSTIVQMGTVPIGTPSNYTIVVAGDHYQFTLNNVTISLPRASTTNLAGPYKLVPYFGGNAVAPHQIAIKIVEN
jgi:hypothetical protein